MDRETRRQFEAFRRDAGPIENQVLDDLLHGECDRREFLQRGTMFGLSISALAAALTAAGEAPLAFARNKVRVGGRLKLAINGAPYGAIEPYLFNSLAGVNIAAPSAEYLIRVNSKNITTPELATSWSPSANGSRWTVRLRRNVRFHGGQAFSSADVVQTYKLLTDPAKGSAALTSFQGILTPDGISAPSPDTVVFELETPLAAFPYSIGSTTYQTMILPASYEIGTFVTKPQGTGPFVLRSYTTAASARYDRFDGWWGGRPPLDGIDATVYTSTTAMNAALLSGAADLIDGGADRTLFGKPNVQIFRIPGGGMAQVAMRVDKPPWNDVRVRQALALAVGRPQMIRPVYGAGGATIGNDHPFAPIYPSSVPIPQRVRNLKLAKELLAAAGHPRGFSATLTTGNEPIKATIAQIVQAAARTIGIRIRLQMLDPTVYYGGTPATTPWLNAPLTVTTWASRPIVNQYLTATLMSTGVWNAARYKSKRFDALAKSFFGAIALTDARKYARQIETLVQRDTPDLVLLWSSVTTAGSTKVQGFQILPIGLSLGRVSLNA